MIGHIVAEMPEKCIPKMKSWMILRFTGYQAPKSWTERAYPHLIYFHEVNAGGHFAQREQPQLFARELRTAFKSLRK